MGRASSGSALRGARLGTATLQPSPRPSVRHPQRSERIIPNALLSGFTHHPTRCQEIAVQSSRFTGVKQASDRVGLRLRTGFRCLCGEGPFSCALFYVPEAVEEPGSLVLQVKSSCPPESGKVPA